MSQEHPVVRQRAEEHESEPQSGHAERSAHKRLASPRAFQAIALAASLFAGEPSAEAKKPHHHAPHSEKAATHHVEKNVTRRVESNATHHVEKNATGHVQHKEPHQTMAPVVVKNPSLDSRKDHGLEREVEMAERLGFKNFKTNDDLMQALEDGELVDITPGKDAGYVIDQGLGELTKTPEERLLYTALRAHAAEKLSKIADEFHKKFPHSKLRISSAVRTEQYVDKLRGINPNVAKAHTSTHLKGITVDILYFSPESDRRMEEYRMTPKEQAWLGEYLLTLEAAGEVQATREVHQPVFHVVFYPPKESPHGTILDLDALDPWGKIPSSK
ncbi:MAG: DUF5715 family protein [Patescibacteria group bacterium]